MEYKSYKNNTILVDMLFILLFGLMIMVNTPIEAKKADIEHKAEYMITVTWPINFQDDIDTWTEDPIGNVIWYKDLDEGFTHLDRDDLGSINDTITMPDGKIVTLPYNEEKTSIRGFIPGEWVFNLHYYSKRTLKSGLIHDGVPVDVKIEKLNPISKIIYFKRFLLKVPWEEVTVTRFTMLANGDTINWNQMPKTLIRSTSQYNVSESHTRSPSE